MGGERSHEGRSQGTYLGTSPTPVQHPLGGIKSILLYPTLTPSLKSPQRPHTQALGPSPIPQRYSLILMKITLLPPHHLTPYPNNPRQNEEAVAEVAKSIAEFGFRQPVVVDKNKVIIVGHTRHLAAIQLGLKTIPVHIATDMTETQARAYRLVDNRSAEYSEWDDERLMKEVFGLAHDDGFDIESFGFSTEEMDEGNTLTKKDARHLEDFDVMPTPKPQWILISAPEDDCASVMAAIKKLKIKNLKMECSAFGPGEQE